MHFEKLHAKVPFLILGKGTLTTNSKMTESVNTENQGKKTEAVSRSCNDT